MTQALTKGARITGDQRSKLAREYAERYAGGESIRSIAVDSGRSFGFVHGVLTEAGVELRGRGGATRRGTGEASGPQQKVAAAPKKAAKKATTKAAKAPAARKAPATKTASAKKAATTTTA